MFNVDKHNDDDLIRIQDLASWFCWSQKTTYREYSRIGVPFVKIGGSLRFRVGSVRTFLAEREAQHRGNAA